MPLVLSLAQKEDYFITLKKAFSDFLHFEEMLANPIRDLIAKSCTQDFDSKFMEGLLVRYLGNNYEAHYVTKDQKDALLMIKYGLFATVIFLFAKTPTAQRSFFQSTDDLMQNYPEFNDELVELGVAGRGKELQYLLIFRNYLVAALLLLPGKDNKKVFLRVIERLEGANEEYITGTGQKPSTTRRCLIYHRESGIPMTKKRSRKPKSENLEPVSTDMELEGISEVKAKKIRKVVRNAVSRQVSGMSTISSNSDQTIHVPLSAAPSTSFSEIGMEDEVMEWGLLPSHYSDRMNTTPASSSSSIGFFQSEEQMEFDSEEHDRLLQDLYEGSFTEFVSGVFF